MKQKYKGTNPEHQRVRGKKNPKINVVDESSTNEASEDQQKKQAELSKGNIEQLGRGGEQKVMKPEWGLKVQDLEGNVVEFDGFNLNSDEAMGLVIEIKQPMMATGRYMNLNVDDKNLDQKCGRIYDLQLNFPCRVNSQKSEAMFQTESRILRFKGILYQEDEEFDMDLANFGKVTEENDDNILEQNKRKINEKNIKLETNLLDDLV